MTDEQNPYNPENYDPADYEIFYLCNKETKEALPVIKVNLETSEEEILNHYFDDYPDDKYELVSQYSPKIKGYTVI